MNRCDTAVRELLVPGQMVQYSLYWCTNNYSYKTNNQIGTSTRDLVLVLFLIHSPQKAIRKTRVTQRHSNHSDAFISAVLFFTVCDQITEVQVRVGGYNTTASTHWLAGRLATNTH